MLGTSPFRNTRKAGGASANRQPARLQARARPTLRARRYHAGIELFFPEQGYKLSAAVRTDLIARTKIFPPSRWKSGDEIRASYKPATIQLASTLEQLVATSNQRLKKASKHEDDASQNLLTALDIIVTGKKILIFSGRNTASGRLEPHGAVAAALLADALYRSNKVAILVSDYMQRSLTRCILKSIESDYDPYIKYDAIRAVNGELFEYLEKLTEEQRPDAAIFIDIPGRNENGDYLDENGEHHIDDHNVCFDQALQLFNALGLPSIAICSKPNDAGFAAAKIPAAGESEKKVFTALAAQCAILADDVTVGALALSELVTRAYRKEAACDAKKLGELIGKANEKVLKPDLVAPCYRAIPRHRHSDMPKVPHTPISTELCVDMLKEMQKQTEQVEVKGPKELTHYHDYGPEVRDLVLYDSSDGALIAMKSFLGYLRARSNEEFNIVTVTDHAKAPYGSQGKNLFSIIINGMRYSMLLRPDCIVMLCNTACSKNLPKVREIVAALLKEAGVDMPVVVLDLIETTAEAIVKYGGERPVILCTEATAKNKAYEQAAKAAAKRLNKREPMLTVIACGNSEDKNLKDLDWATLGNDKKHLSQDPEDQRLVRREIGRYSSQVPANATSIFLCCTHYAALRRLIEESVQSHFHQAGRELNDRHIKHFIVDPIEYQADAAAKFLADNPRPADKKRSQKNIKVVTTGKDVETVKDSTRIYTAGMNLDKFISDEPENVELDDEKGKAGEAAAKPAKEISVTRVHFDELKLTNEFTKRFGLDKHGNPLPGADMPDKPV